MGGEAAGLERMGVLVAGRVGALGEAGNGGILTVRARRWKSRLVMQAAEPAEREGVRSGPRMRREMPTTYWRAASEHGDISREFVEK